MPLPGDANHDGKVDINDLTIVLAHYGQTGTTWSQGEFTGDGTVDINDLTIVLAHYGRARRRRPQAWRQCPSRQLGDARRSVVGRGLGGCPSPQLSAARQ